VLTEKYLQLLKQERYAIGQSTFLRGNATPRLVENDVLPMEEIITAGTRL